MTANVGDLTVTRLEVSTTGVAWVTLDRPAAANARNQAMRDELSRLWNHLETSTDVRIVVLTGAGDRHFCAGMDLKESGVPERVDQTRERLRGSTDVEQLARLPQPTIAAINGFALGGGFEMALACDLRVMATEAQVGLPEVRHGLMPGRGGTQRLPRLIGISQALELLYLGTTLDGPAATAAGLVNRHVPRAKLASTVDALVDELLAKPQTALRAIKRSVRRGLEMPLTDAVDQELDELIFLMAERTNGHAR